MRPVLSRKLAALFVFGCLTAAAPAQMYPMGYPQPYGGYPSAYNPYYNSYQRNPYYGYAPQAPVNYYQTVAPTPVPAPTVIATPAPATESTPIIITPAPSNVNSTPAIRPSVPTFTVREPLPTSQTYSLPDPANSTPPGAILGSTGAPCQTHEACCCKETDPWTGFYVGGNVGGGVGAESTTQSLMFSSTAIGTNTLLTNNGTYTSTGVIVGGQVGYNYQVNCRFVAGVEGDWQWASQQETSHTTTPPGTTAFFGAGASAYGFSLTDEHQLTNFGTVRGRAGVVFGNSLLYGTGGLAWGTVKDTLSNNGSVNPVLFGAPGQATGPLLPTTDTFTQTRVGWTVGAGIETRLSCHWSLKFEYLFIDLGRVNHTMPIAFNPAFGPLFGAGGVASATSSWLATENVIRIGLNYKF